MRRSYSISFEYRESSSYLALVVYTSFAIVVQISKSVWSIEPQCRRKKQDKQAKCFPKRNEGDKCATSKRQKKEKLEWKTCEEGLLPFRQQSGPKK